jgi:uncharacterized surface protein with fasciclin (FAS1) repeats
MRRSVLFILFVVCGSSLFAQITPPVAAPANDSLKIKTAKSIPFKLNNSKTKMLSLNNITDNIAANKSFSKFYNAIQVAGLMETFKSQGPITIFAPDDEAFKKMKPGMLDTLLKPTHQPELIAFITYHAVAGKLTSKAIAKQINANKNSVAFITLSGSKLTGTIDENRNIVLTDETRGRCVVKQLDVEQSNGMLFIIDGVLIPKNKLL